MSSTAADVSLASPPNTAAGAFTEKRIVILIISVVVLLTSLPYLLAFSISETFVGQIYNVVDYSVYLSWTRQAADGHFGILNLFTTLKQHRYLFNALFLLLGSIVRLTHLPIPVVFLIVRTVGAIVLLRLAYMLCRVAYPTSVSARVTSLGLIAFSSGFGWVYWPRWANINPQGVSVDVWQPEAFTFLSIYTSALFVVSTCFILAAIYNLVRGEQTGKLKYGAYAGLCGLTLGNIHSYDVLHIAAAWGLYLVAITVIKRKFDLNRWLRAIVAGAVTLPSTAYQYWVYRHDSVFKQRADTPTWSPNFFYYAMGYGLVFILAVSIVVFLFTNRKKIAGYFADTQVLTWVVSWAVAGLAIVYLPVQFQRKMAMGEHIPLCILAGGAAAFLVSYLRPRFQPIALAGLVVSTCPTNALFLAREYNHIEENKSEISDAQPFLTRPQLDILHWIRDNTRSNDAILALPPIGQFVPGYCDRAVWVGHWSETPHYGTKLSKLFHVLSIETPEDRRHMFLLKTGADYLVYPEDAAEAPLPSRHGDIYLADLYDNPPSYLQPVYSTPAMPSGPADPKIGAYVIFAIKP